jgi:predicted Zn-dependent protease
MATPNSRSAGLPSPCRAPRWRGLLGSALTALVLLGGSPASAAEQPWSDEGRMALAMPQDAGALQAFAAELGRADSMVEEAILGFRELLRTGKLEGALERDLSTLLLARPVEPGWRDLYLRMATASADEDESFAWSVRAAQARLIGGAPKDAVKDLTALRSKRPDRQDAALLLGHALLLTGDFKAAEAVFRAWPQSAEAREGLLLATLPSTMADNEAYWRTQLRAGGTPDARVDEALAGLAADAADQRAAVLRALYYSGRAGDAAVRQALPLVSGDPLPKVLGPASRIDRAAVLRMYGYDLVAASVLKEAGAADAPATDNAATWSELGRLQLVLLDYAGAQASFEKGLAIIPGDDVMVHGLGEAMYGLKKYAEAEKIIGSSDAALAARIRAAATATAALATSSKADDLDGLKAAFALDNSTPWIAEAYGVRLYDEGLLEQSRTPLRAAATARPANANVVTRYVNASASTGEAQSAIEFARRGLARTLSETERAALAGTLGFAWVKRGEELRVSGAITDVADAYAVAHLLNPDDPGILRALGGAWWSAGKLEQAWTTYVSAFQMDPKDKGGLEALVGLGAQLGREAEVRRLLGAYSDDATVRSVLRNLDFQLELAQAGEALRRGELADAYNRYLRLQAKDPTNPDVLRGLASVKLAEGDEEAALVLFRKARAAQPGNPWALLGEANALISAGDLTAAEATLAELQGTTDIALAAEVKRAKVRLLVRQGQLLEKADRDHEAWRAFADALELGPDTWVCHNLGTLYAKHHQYDLAQAFFEEAFFLDATNLYARLGKASLLIERGWLEEAQTVLEQLPPDDPDVAAARRSLEVARAVREADVARRVGDTDEARRIVQTVYEKYPSDPAAKAAWENEQLGSQEAEEVLATARQILISDPTNTRALGAALNAAHTLRKTDTILPLYETAAARGGDDEKAWLERARITASTEKALVMHGEARHDDAVELLGALEERAGDDIPSWSIIGGAWLEIRETREALEAFDSALKIDSEDPSALAGKAGTLSTMGRTAEGIELLEAAWDEHHDPTVGLTLAELYRARHQLKQVDETLAELDALSNDREPTDPLPALALPSGREPEPLAAAPRPYVLSPAQEAQRRDLRESSPGGGWRPAFDLGAGGYGRRGIAGETHLLGFFIPVRLHELRAGPVSFDIEAVPYFMTDYEDEAYGALLSAGLAAGAGPVGMQVRGGVSPVGFATRPYFIWYGSVDIRASEQVSLGLVTSREPVTDSLTSWAGKERRGVFFGRVHRTGFGGYLNVMPTEVDRLSLYGRGGWNEGLEMNRVPFWEGLFQGSHTFAWNTFDFKLGGMLFGMSFREQVDKFRPGQGGFFSPALFVSGQAKLEGKYHAPNDRFNLCVGGGLGAQFIQAEYVENTDDYIRPGVFFGYSVNAGVDWRMAKYWWLGGDFHYTVSGADWYQTIGMIHLGYGPNNAWARAQQPVFSPLAGQPIVQGQPCGN